MNKTSAKIRVYAALTVWLLLCVSMFGYFFNLLDNSNEQLVFAIQKERKQLAQAQGEEKSYQLASQDLSTVAAAQYQPTDFFSKDVTLVKEIETLENLSTAYNIQMSISGVAGTVETLPSAQTKSPLLIVPATVGITGSFSDCIAFLQSVEHLSFITTVTSLNANSASNNQVNMQIGLNFYILNQAE